MRLCMVVFDAAFEQEVMNALSAGGRIGFTKWSRVQGQGERSDPRLDQAVWPGFNQVVMAVVPQEQAREVVARLAELRSGEQKVGISVFAWPVEQLL